MTIRCFLHYRNYTNYILIYRKYYYKWINQFYQYENGYKSGHILGFIRSIHLQYTHKISSSIMTYLFNDVRLAMYNNDMFVYDIYIKFYLLRNDFDPLFHNIISEYASLIRSLTSNYRHQSDYMNKTIITNLYNHILSKPLSIFN